MIQFMLLTYYSFSYIIFSAYFPLYVLQIVIPLDQFGIKLKLQNICEIKNLMKQLSQRMDNPGKTKTLIENFENEQYKKYNSSSHKRQSTHRGGDLNIRGQRVRNILHLLSENSNKQIEVNENLKSNDQLNTNTLTNGRINSFHEQLNVKRDSHDIKNLIQQTPINISRSNKKYSFNDHIPIVDSNSWVETDFKLRALEIENSQLQNEIKRNDNLADEVSELRYDLVELKNKFLELCEIVNDLPVHRSPNSNAADPSNDINEERNSITNFTTSLSQQNNFQSTYNYKIENNEQNQFQIHKFSLIDKFNDIQLPTTGGNTGNKSGQETKDKKDVNLHTGDILYNLVSNARVSEQQEVDLKASIIIDGQLVISNVVQYSIIMKNKHNEIVHANKRQSSLRDFQREFIEQNPDVMLSAFPRKNIFNLFQATLDHPQIIERRNALQNWLNLCIVHQTFLEALQSYMQIAEPDNQFVYWIGNSKIIEQNVKLESFRLYKINNLKLDMNRGSISMQEGNIIIIGGLIDSQTIDDIIIFKKGQFLHSMHKLNIARQLQHSVIIQDKCQIIGGLDSKFRASATMEVLNLKELPVDPNHNISKIKRCSIAAPMHHSRHNFSIYPSASTNTIQVCGGEGEPSKFSLEQQKIENNCWTIVRLECKVQQTNFAFLVNEQKDILMFGGNDSHKDSSKIWKFDGKSMKETGELAKPDQFPYNNIVEDESYLYLIGNHIHKYNKQKEKWSIVQQPENFKLSNQNKCMSNVTKHRID